MRTQAQGLILKKLFLVYPKPLPPCPFYGEGRGIGGGDAVIGENPKLTVIVARSLEGVFGRVP